MTGLEEGWTPIWFRWWEVSEKQGRSRPESWIQIVLGGHIAKREFWEGSGAKGRTPYLREFGAWLPAAHLETRAPCA
jgi:hypothetical protein